MGTKATFDPVNKLITLIEAPDIGGFVTVDVQKDLYSAAKKDWRDDLALNKYRFPFTTFGGNDIGGGKRAGAYYFLDNAAGWRIRPYSADHELTLVGNLFGIDPAQRLFVGAASMDQVVIRLDTSSLTQAIETGGGGGATAEEIADAVWDENLTAHATTDSAGKWLDDARRPDGKVYVNVSAATNGDGTAAHPFNNWADTYAYGAANDYKSVVFKGHNSYDGFPFLTITDDIYGWHLHAENMLFLNYAQADLSSGTILRPRITGQFVLHTSHSGIPIVEDGVNLIGDLFAPNTPYHFPENGSNVRVSGGVVDFDRNIIIENMWLTGEVHFDCTNTDVHEMYLSPVVGGIIRLQNYATTESLSHIDIVMQGTEVIIEASCTGPRPITLRGHGKVTNLSTANVIDETVSNAVWDEVL